MIPAGIKNALSTLAPEGVVETEFSEKGYHLEAALPADQVAVAADVFDREGFFLEAITGVDWLAEGQMEVVYDYNHFHSPCRVVVRTRVDRDNPEVPTISQTFSGALWHERETHDFFGIIFTGHPDLSPLLLPEDADFHPLRKDYTP